MSQFTSYLAATATPFATSATLPPLPPIVVRRASVAPPLKPSRCTPPKPVQCVKTGAIYESYEAASRAVGLSNGNKIGLAVRRGTIAAGSQWCTPGTPPVARPIAGFRGSARKQVRRENDGFAYVSCKAASIANGVSADAIERAVKFGGTCAGSRWTAVAVRKTIPAEGHPFGAPAVHGRQTVCTTPFHDVEQMVATFTPIVQVIAKTFVRRFKADRETRYEEAFADGLLGLLRASQRPFETVGPAKFATWVRRHIENQIRWSFAQRRRTNFRSEAGHAMTILSFADLQPFDASDDSFTVESTLEAPQHDASLQYVAIETSFETMVAILEPADRELFHRRFVRDRSNEDIAAELQMDMSTLEARFERAFETVRAHVTALAAA